MKIENQIFESKFHRQYVGGQGEIVEKEVTIVPKEYKGISYEEVLEEYRWYVNDKNAELPEEIMDQLRRDGKI